MINYDDYDNDDTPTKGKMSASPDRMVNHNMATLKRVEGRINRYRRTNPQSAAARQLENAQ